MLPASPSLPIFPLSIIFYLTFGGRGAKDRCSRPTACPSFVSDLYDLIGNQKEVLSCHLQSILAEPSRTLMLPSTANAAGSCPLWMLTPGFCSFWKLLLEIPAGIRVWNMVVCYHWAKSGRKAPLWVFKLTQGIWEQPISSLMFGLPWRPHDLLCCNLVSEILLVEHLYMDLFSDQLENSYNMVTEPRNN